ncbi:DinB family protein [Kitasatospora sp. DSM 101779]|uniref:DinB family protein n=1 Tax=Kitasatospora sp. DSM 101779 TaxID=2853165 RepID=UPI0021DAD2E9|nr:DinB family protein [Kitasatospora sp. DSM 101779]MCU7822105.1 DinB family protein [Kitasatospora sp. DSM 101779]
METWGAALYGDPCAACGFAWSATPAECVGTVGELPRRFRELLDGRTGRERHPELEWTPAAYVSHVTDNLRIWAERLAGARLAGAAEVGGYDPDLVARGRRYLEIAPAAALWSLDRAVQAWTESVTAAVEAGTVLQHATRGPQAAEVIARNNAHDGHHHVHDVRRILHHTDTR